ncbi:MAG: hypothetical protein J0M12_08755 [Deltaproteobacteria bacterium]|nr:hypothetical protein [Deltaproteobacteria bacterium]
MAQKHPIWRSEIEFTEFLRELEKLCQASQHVVTSSDGQLKFHFSVLETNLGRVDVFRYQRREAWDSGEPASVQIGQGMFRYGESIVQVTDLCDSGYKYVLPYPEVALYTVASAPSLEQIVQAVKGGRNVSEDFTWQGP